MPAVLFLSSSSFLYPTLSSSLFKADFEIPTFFAQAVIFPL